MGIDLVLSTFKGRKTPPKSDLHVSSCEIKFHKNWKIFSFLEIMGVVPTLHVFEESHCDCGHN